MNKKIMIITSLVIITILTFTAGINYFVSKNGSIKKSGDETSSIPKVSEVYVEKGLEYYKKIVEPAVENYLDQDSSESVSDRNIRLSKYFGKDSPVYTYKQSNLDLNVKKSTAEVTSITSSEAEGEDLCLIVTSNVTYFSNDGAVTTEVKSYWITLKMGPDGEYSTPNDIGLWIE